MSASYAPFSEFEIHIRHYIERYKRPYPSSLSSLPVSTPGNHSNTRAGAENKINIEISTASSEDVRGISYTKLGPAPYPKSGNILDTPDILWTEDKWDEDNRIEYRIC